MTDETMTFAEVQTSVISTMVMLVSPDAVFTPEQRLVDTGVDSLDFVEFVMMLEDVFPQVDLSDYDPDEKATFAEIATEIAFRLGVSDIPGKPE